jgi:PKD repeat protein
MPPTLVVAVFAMALATLGCGKEGNPVALPTDPNGGPQSPVTLAVKSDQSQLTAGATTPAVLTVTALHTDGTPATNGTSVSLSTSLGAFSFDTGGKPVQLTTATLQSGRATVQLFAGSTAGTANVMVSMGTLVTGLNLPIVTAPAVPVADFTFTTSGLTVLFADASTGGAATSYSWTFGDALTSTEKNPSHTYPSAATYSVMLIVTNTSGSSSKSKFVTVSLGTAPVALFESTVNGKQVNFVDKSTGGATSWAWSFGDGGTDNVRNPIHTYAAAGTYTVTLTASNAAGSNSTSDVVTIAAGTPPVAAFTFTVTGSQVNFVDASMNSPTTWVWSFGDGGQSTQQNPIHTYAASGAYTVTLTANNASGSNSTSNVVTIAPGTPPVSKFTFKANDLTVNFADASTGNPTSWSWSFGDGTQSTQQNPVHTYAAAGNYTVTLTVGNSAGTNASNQIVTVTAGAAPTAAFSYTLGTAFKVNFVDASTGNPTAWFWDFGDGFFSSAQNPVHTYTATGNYTVSLTAFNANGQNKATQVVTPVP